MGMVLAVGLGLMPESEAQVRTDHPRLFVASGALAGLRTRLTADTRFTSTLVGYMNRRRADPTGADTMLRGNYPNQLMLTAAFEALIQPSTLHVTTAKGYLTTLVGIAPDTNLTATRNRLYAIAVAYDWLWDQLTTTERSTTRNAIVTYVNSLAQYFDPAQGLNFIESPSRWANAVALAGAVALANDDTRLDATLTQLLSNWRHSTPHRTSWARGAVIRWLGCTVLRTAASSPTFSGARLQLPRKRGTAPSSKTRRISTLRGQRHAAHGTHWKLLVLGARDLHHGPTVRGFGMVWQWAC